MMGSHQTQSIECDPMISAHPGDMIQYIEDIYSFAVNTINIVIE